MVRHATAFLAAAALATFPAPGAAQVTPQQQPDPAVETLYLIGQKSRAAAGLAEFVLPILGHAYAGDWGAGRSPAALSLFGGMLAWRSAAHGDDDGFRAGVLTYAAGRIWGIASAVSTARSWNADLRLRLEVGMAPGGGVEAGVRVAAR